MEISSRYSWIVPMTISISFDRWALNSSKVKSKFYQRNHDDTITNVKSENSMVVRIIFEVQVVEKQRRLDR